MHDSTKQRKQEIRALVDEYYEPGRQDRCKLWIYRHVIYPKYRISEATFFRYLSEDDDKKTFDGQLSLF